MIKNILTQVLLLFCSVTYAQSSRSVIKKAHPFVAYELSQAVFNDFKSYSGEIGIRFRNNQILRLTHMNINMSEDHLSSDFVVVVNGDNVEGKQFGFEAFYDFPMFFKQLYISPSFGWYRNEYNHTTLNESISKKSATIGMAVSFREVNVFRIKGLYYTVSIPIRTPFNPIRKTKLGNTIIKNNTLDSNIFFFIGLEF